MKSLHMYLRELKLGKRTAFEGLTMFSLERPADRALEYLTLDEALHRGLAQVSEISDSGRVSELAFSNIGDLPVLILDGEELVGAKQNRTVNLTILAPARATTSIPVSCVEAGRCSVLFSEVEREGAPAGAESPLTEAGTGTR